MERIMGRRGLADGDVLERVDEAEMVDREN
jgi:hypothetical protein